MTATLKALHELRQDKGEKRQPTFLNDLRDLDLVLKDQGESHPYELGNAKLGALMAHGSFKNGGAGSLANLPTTDYLYRISSISKILSYSQDWNSASPRKMDHPWVVFRVWQTQLERTKKWLPLSDYAKGTFASPRGISFWSSTELEASDVRALLQTVHGMGIPNNWLEEYCAILRCRVTHLKDDSRIPTVLDAFNSNIFHPTNESELPTTGVAIRLSITSSLATGHDEFVLRGVTTDAIELYPVFIPNAASSYIDSFDSRLVSLLASYYQTL